MPPAITVSPRRVTPSRIYCTTPTSRSPKPSPSRARVWPLGKNCSLNVCLNEYSYLTDFQCFGLGRKLRFKEGMLGTPISVLGGWPTVSARYLHTRRQGQCCRLNVYGNSVHTSTSSWW